jgi:hypothetical protein
VPLPARRLQIGQTIRWSKFAFRNLDDDAVENLRQLPGLHGHNGVQGVRADRVTSLLRFMALLLLVLNILVQLSEPIDPKSNTNRILVSTTTDVGQATVGFQRSRGLIFQNYMVHLKSHVKARHHLFTAIQPERDDSLSMKSVKPARNLFEFQSILRGGGDDSEEEDDSDATWIYRSAVEKNPQDVEAMAGLGRAYADGRGKSKPSCCTRDSPKKTLERPNRNSFLAVEPLLVLQYTTHRI